MELLYSIWLTGFLLLVLPAILSLFVMCALTFECRPNWYEKVSLVAVGFVWALLWPLILLITLFAFLCGLFGKR